MRVKCLCEAPLHVCNSKTVDHSLEPEKSAQIVYSITAVNRYSPSIVSGVCVNESVYIYTNKDGEHEDG